MGNRIQLEQRYTKKEILAMYLNKYDFGYQADGVQSAAKIFFNKTPQTLSIEESATSGWYVEKLFFIQSHQKSGKGSGAKKHRV
jgi:hypothetical protein